MVLASLAAAIAGTNPIKTGTTAFFYSMHTAILPFLSIFNTQLLMINITGTFHFALTVISAIVAMLVFAAATPGYFFGAQPLVGGYRPAADHVHAFPARFLVGHVAPAVRPAVGLPVLSTPGSAARALRQRLAR